MQSNPIIDRLPKHLLSFIIDQDYSRYSPQDQAVWRYVMKQNMAHLSKVAHHSYTQGLKSTGISLDHIPSIEEMNHALGKIGWAAVTVDGFIPPSAFMEFQMHHILVIAADIRSFNQIEYTPAPDIIHEAAGHAPIIADPEYAEYLRYFGEIGSKAFSSEKDHHLYEVIRHLSILKANPVTPPEKIEEAEACLKQTSEEMGMPSEMTLIRNLHWWTVEYGLIGSLKRPKIYGAGLLSSIGESMGALKPEVIKIPYSIDAMDFAFDITKPQPQLFVTPDFQHLSTVLNEFADQMALRTGGLEGIMKAIQSGNTATLEYASGLQVSGTFTHVEIHNGQAIYINTTGPTTLNYQGKMLEGHSKNQHKDGFGSPIGKIKGSLKPTRLLDDHDLADLGIIAGKKCILEFESELRVEGTLYSILRKEEHLILMSFTDCRVTHGGKTLFEPGWGIYDMAIGEKITAAYNGPADADGFNLHYEAPQEKTQRINYDHRTQGLHNLYARLRKAKEGHTEPAAIEEIWENLITHYPEDWLLPLEILETLNEQNPPHPLSAKIKKRLQQLSKDNPSVRDLIINGLKVY